jgi:lipoprotein-releasing system permease protein
VSFEFRLAFKYFRARKKSLARFTSVVAVIGIAAGVASLIIAQGLANGFADEMRDKILANTAHIAVFLKDTAEISNWQEIKTELEKTENVREVSPTTYENALLIGETETSYAILKVSSSKFQVPSQTDSKVPGQSNGKPGTWNLEPGTISVGKQLAEKLNLKIGDSAQIVTLENQTPSLVRIAEVFETGLYDYDLTWVYVSPEKFARLHGQPAFTPTILSISVKDIYKADETAREIRARLGENFKVIDWQEANRPLFAALGLERKATFVIISLIIFIAALNITTTLALLVNERRLDIAVLRTCGAKGKSLIMIFLIEGLFLGLIGVFSGVAFGLFGCLIGNYFRLVSLAAEVYSLNYIPLHPQAGNILLIIVMTFFLCLTATFYPAFRASRIKPSENLRTQ